MASATNITGLNSTTAFTVAFWHRSRPDSLRQTYNSDVFSQRSTANVNRDGFALYFQSGSLNVNLCAAAANSQSTMGVANTEFVPGRWAHYAVVYSQALQRVTLYKNGISRATATNATVVTANAACTTEFGAGSYQSAANHSLFDFQYAVNSALDSAEIGLLMDPRQRHPSITARYFGLGTGGYGASGLVIDETGNGFNLTANANGGAVTLTDIPPFLPTLA